MGLFNAFRFNPKKSLLEEVVSSISHLLSTKQTFGAWQKDLGMDDYSNLNHSKEILKKIADNIVLNIEKYEKRLELKEINLTEFKSFADFTFELKGMIQGQLKKFCIKISRVRGINVSIQTDDGEV